MLVHSEVYSSNTEVIKFVSDVRQIGSFLRETKCNICTFVLMYVLSLEKGRKALVDFSCLFFSDSKYILSIDSALTIYLFCNVKKKKKNPKQLSNSTEKIFRYVPFHIHAIVDCFLLFSLHESGTRR